MGKKILYIVIIIALIIAGIFTAKKITEKDKTEQTVANTLENTNKTHEEHKPEENILEENNIATEKTEKNEVEKNNVAEGKDEKAPEEQAKQIVEDNWGEDSTVYFSYDGKDEHGRYIICVREKASTKALYWYYVDVETGTFDIK